MIFAESRRHLRSAIASDAEEIFQPPPIMTVSEWSDANRYLPATSAEPGRFRTSRVPYLRRIMDVLGSETVREVVFAKAAQVCGSTAAENFLGYLMDQAPCAILEVWPTEKALKAWSTKRLDPMINDTPCLKAKFPRTGRRDSADSIFSKQFPGGYIQALTAKSTADLRSHSARVWVAEEVDEWEGDLGEQGDPLSLLRARARTFWNAKGYMVSTPTIRGFSRIWTELESSTWEEYWVPCPHCNHFQTLRWRDANEDEAAAGEYRLVWEKDSAGDLIPGTVCYICENCSELIPERHKISMLEQGEWRARFPSRRKVGFHINTIYSPLCPWDEIITAFLSALKRPAEMKTFVNTMQGLPYEEEGDKVEKGFLAKRAEKYAAAVPNGVGLLVAGVDVQGDRNELFVWGFGAGEESWLIAWEQLDGDPNQDEVWRLLDRRLLSLWQHEGGAQMRISACAIDAGYLTDRVHRFCASRAARRIIPMVGRDGRGRKLIEAPSADKYRRSTKGGQRKKRPTHILGSDSGKDMLYGRLRITKPGPGYVHFPDTVDPMFFEQITSEKLVTKYKNRRPIRVWEKLPDRRNEALDGTLLAMAALHSLGLVVVNALERLAAEVTAAGKTTAEVKPVVSGRRMLSGGIEQ
jgi:phage terminase large subunit GpA-like protein